MDVYSSQPYCISFFYLQIKPFYMHLFYLHSLWSYLHKLWSYLLTIHTGQKYEVRAYMHPNLM